ncbi:Protein of unknown function [Chitinophaga sp. CF118]|uniref:DUF2281 domain-containing protein n=1 Tax=Chitinophaga sp. CF118 TaxID=1884367 RepID=UPI0008F17DF3|nr:DUF2281 domain-containing protein [Chitinophaga sp. CF118]SFD28656.1 Protein of unknown function [Chitinophaga sp. CF118]
MNNNFIEKINQLPLDKQQEVEDFVNFLISKYQAGSTNIKAAEKRKSNMGWAKGKIWVTDDFNIQRIW